MCRADNVNGLILASSPTFKNETGYPSLWYFRRAKYEISVYRSFLSKCGNKI